MASGDAMAAAFGVKALVDSGIDSVPSLFIRPLHERANAKVPDAHETQQRLPVIDLSKLEGPDRAATLDAIHRACKEWGFFQVINHGVPPELIARVQDLADRFHRLPAEEKLAPAFQSGPGVHKAVGTFASSLAAYVKQETTKDWRDVLTFTFAPGWEEAPGAWPDKPAVFEETVTEYVHAVQALSYRLLAVISENLGIPVDYFERDMVFEKVMTWNYYPPCPEPDLTLGLKSHADWGTVTVLLPSQVPGLQVKKGGEWIPVEPHSEAIVVNLGDCLQAISNDLYISADHRAVVNSDKDRISIGYFMLPSPKQIVSVAPPLVSPQRPAHYRPYSFGDFLKVVSDAPELPDRGSVLGNFRLLAVG